MRLNPAVNQTLLTMSFYNEVSAEIQPKNIEWHVPPDGSMTLKSRAKSNTERHYSPELGSQITQIHRIQKSYFRFWCWRGLFLLDSVVSFQAGIIFKPQT